MGCGRYFPETDAVRAFQLECLLHCFFLAVVETEPLPLSVDAVHRPAWEDASLNYKAPVGRVFGATTWIFSYHFKYFDDFPNWKFGPWKVDLLDCFSDSVFDVVAAFEQFLAGDGFCDPVGREHKAFAVLL